MKRKILIALYIILILITLKLTYSITINSILINKYNNGEYYENQAKALTFLNFSQRYVANYNYGNIFYQNGEYESAIEKYEEALKGMIPKYKECNIRINYALAICKTVKVDEKDQDSVKNAIKTYESAIDILTQKGCANKSDNNGHNQKAEQLKKDIQKEIDRLKKIQKEDDRDSEEEEKKEQDNKNKDNTETIETKIKDIKEDATKEQRETEILYKDYDTDYNIKGKNW